MHDVEAIIANSSVLQSILTGFRHAVLFPLTKELALLPITDDFANEVKDYGITASMSEDLPLPSLPPGLVKFAKEVSRSNSVAYVRTYYFGGFGSQDAVVWENEKLVFGPANDSYNDGWPNSAISQALRKLGVQAKEGEDEFDTAGLGRYRETHRWADAAKNMQA